MAAAIGLIVEGYVSLNDQKALDELRMQRRKLIADLNACTGIDCASTIQQIEEDIVVIEAGLARLDGAATRSPTSCSRSARRLNFLLRSTHHNLERAIRQRPL